MPRKKKSLAEKRAENALHAKNYYRRKNPKKVLHLNFPYLLPYWNKWQPHLVRQLLKYRGISIREMELKYDVISKGTFFDWEESEFSLTGELLQSLTSFAESQGWWSIYPFPPKVVLVLARTAKDMITFCTYYNIPIGEARWIRTPRQLKPYLYTQVKWIAVPNVKKLNGLHLHPVLTRFAKCCASTQKRESVMWKPLIGSRRAVPQA